MSGEQDLEKQGSYLESMDPEDLELTIEIGRILSAEVRRVQKKAIDSKDAYWVYDRPKKRPARIRLSLNRPLSDSEKVFFHDDLGKTGFKNDDGVIRSMFAKWEPHSYSYRGDFRDFRVRLSVNEQVYAESTTMGSVRLSAAVTKLLEDYFLNLHPVDVKTLREIG